MTQRSTIRPTRATAPVRADLAGGTADLWPLGLLHEGAMTVAVAVSLEVSADVRPLGNFGAIVVRSADLGVDRRIAAADLRGTVRRGPLELLERVARACGTGGGFTLESRSPVRAGSGLGTSSALGVAAAAAVLRATGRRSPGPALVALIRDLEAQVLGIPTGTQDHEAALRGGIVVLRHLPGGTVVTRDAGPRLAALAAHLVLVDSRQARSSGPSNWDMVRRRIDGDASAVRALAGVARAGRAAAEALEAGDWRALGRAMRADLEARCRWSPLVLTPRLEAIFDAARRSGALGWRVCGAGGGGYAVVLAKPEARQRIGHAIEEAGGALAAARPTARGLRVQGSR